MQTAGVVARYCNNSETADEMCNIEDICKNSSIICSVDGSDMDDYKRDRSVPLRIGHSETSKQ